MTFDIRPFSKRLHQNLLNLGSVKLNLIFNLSKQVMGSSGKKYKEKESRKRRHRSRSTSPEYEASKEKKHRHRKHHHRERKREKTSKHDYESDSDIEIIQDDSPKRSSSPEATGQSVESLSIEETNKLRAKLGLKPLEVSSDSGPSSSGAGSSKKKDDPNKKKDDWGEFYHKPAENLTDKTEQEKLRSKLADYKEKRSLQAKLSKVKLLGESDSEDDLESWVDKSRKIEDAKKEAEKRVKLNLIVNNDKFCIKILILG